MISMLSLLRRIDRFAVLSPLIAPPRGRGRGREGVAATQTPKRASILQLIYIDLS